MLKLSTFVKAVSSGSPISWYRAPLSQVKGPTSGVTTLITQICSDSGSRVPVPTQSSVDADRAIKKKATREKYTPRI